MSLFTLVQPFVPSRIGFMPNGKIFIGEQLWYRDEEKLRRQAVQDGLGNEAIVLDDDAPRPLSLAGWAAVGLWGSLVVAGMARLAVAGERREFALLVLLGGVAGAEAALIVLGRMNIRPSSIVLGVNSHYTYISLLWSLAASAVLIAPCDGGPRYLRSLEVWPPWQSSGSSQWGSSALEKSTGSTCALQTGSAGSGGRGTRSTPSSTAHGQEPDFRYAVALDPSGQIRHYSDVVLPFVADNDHVDPVTEVRGLVP